MTLPPLPAPVGTRAEALAGPPLELKLGLLHLAVAVVVPSLTSMPPPPPARRRRLCSWEHHRRRTRMEWRINHSPAFFPQQLFPLRAVLSICSALVTRTVLANQEDHRRSVCVCDGGVLVSMSVQSTPHCKPPKVNPPGCCCRATVILAELSHTPAQPPPPPRSCSCSCCG